MRIFLSKISLVTAIVGLLPALALADHQRGRRSYHFSPINHSGRSASYSPYSGAGTRNFGYRESGFRGYRGPDAHRYGEGRYDDEPRFHRYEEPGYGGPIPAASPYLTTAIRQMYLTYLGREPEPGAVRGWVEKYYQSGQSLDEVRIGVMSSRECFARFDFDPERYVNFLLRELTGRHPTHQQMDHWVSRFHSYFGNLDYFCRELVYNVR